MEGTFGTPCEHGDSIARGEYRDHAIMSPHEPDPNREELYDHVAGDSARFWLQRFRDPPKVNHESARSPIDPRTVAR